MPPDQLAILTVLVLAVAFLYSSVGHAGASGYIAVMSLLGLAPAVIKPTALALNILVASIATWQFWRAGHFSWRLFWPFAVLAIPCAFVGGYVNLPTELFKVLVGIVLLFSAMRFFSEPMDDTMRSEPSHLVAVPTGAGLGLLAGLTGTGGGIFLTPLLLLMRWATTKQAAGVSALFILFNSVSGLLGNISSTERIPTFAIPLAIAALIGGTIGSHLGSKRLPHTAIKRLLAIVLLIAGAKLILTG
jgi:uncharacterized membrane protein YfcA